MHVQMAQIGHYGHTINMAMNHYSYIFSYIY